MILSCGLGRHTVRCVKLIILRIAEGLVVISFVADALDEAWTRCGITVRMLYSYQKLYSLHHIISYLSWAMLASSDEQIPRFSLRKD